MDVMKLTAAATIAIGILSLTNHAYAAEVTPSPEVVVVDPPAPPPSSTLKPSAAEDVVRSAIRALRSNDANAFFRLMPEGEQQAAERAWLQVGSGDGNPWIGAMVNRILRASSAADGAEQVSAFIAPLLAMTEPQALAQQLTDPNGELAAGGERRRGSGFGRMIVQSGIAAITSGLLATGLETEQVRALQQWFTALAAWLPTSELNEPTKVRQAAEGLASALSKLGATSVQELGKLPLSQFLERVALALPEFKRALAVYGLELDQALDSVQIAAHDLPPGSAIQGVNAVMVTVTFTAFGGTQVVPLKLVETNGRWWVAADSPVTAWLRSNEMRLFGGGPFRDRGPRGGQRGPRGEPPTEREPPPKPEADPGF